METTRKLTGNLKTLAFLLAAFISVGIPAGYYLLGYENQRAVVATEAYLNSIFLSQAIGESPEYWRYEERRLAEILTHHSSRKYAELRSIISADNEVITTAGEAIAPPLLTVAHNLYDSGIVVGRIEITTSLRPLLARTAVTASISLLLGLAVYLILRLFPLRALATAMRQQHEEKERALALLNNIPDIAWMKDSSGRYIAANGPFGRLCGVHPGELPGRTDAEIWPPDLAQKYMADDREIMASATPRQIEEPIVDTAGRQTWILTTKTPICNDRGEVIGTTGIARDITERKRYENTLREKEAKISTITATAQDAIILIDNDGNISFWNPAAERIFGYCAAEVMGEALHALLAPQRYSEAYLKGFARFRETGEGMAIGRTLELTAVRKGGEEFPVELSLSAMQISNQWHAVGIMRDITVRKRAESETLRRGALVEKLNSSLVALAQDGRIYGGDISVAFRAITEAAARAMGVSRVSIWFYVEENRGIRCIDLYEAGPGVHSQGLLLEAAAYPAYFGELEKEYSIVADDAVSDPRTREFAASYLHPLGITSMLDVPIRISGRVIGVVCHEHVGEPRQWDVEEQSFVTAIAGFTSMAMEIHERVMAENELRLSRARFRNLVETTSDMVWELDAEGVYTFVSDRIFDMLGYRPAEVCGRSTLDFMPPDEVERLSAIFKALAVSQQPFSFLENVNLHKNGQRVIVESSGVPIFDNDGTFRGYSGIDRDITERKLAEEKIRQLNEALEERVAERTRQLLEAQEELVRKEKLSILGQLSGSVGHELRNPLGVMSNAVYFLKMVLTEADETTREYLDIIKHEIDNSQRIITDLLDFARTKIPQTRTVTVRQLLDDSIGKSSIPESVAVLTEIPDSLPLLLVDPLQMGQVFQNLITNAVQAMPNGGALTVRARIQTSKLVPDADCVEISVEDTGEGISPENMNKLFQPLFTTKAKGIGLGLVVCRNLVEANRGRIKVESRPGEGTIFNVMLPVHGEGL